MSRKNNYLGELTDYINKNLKKGYTKESLRWALADQGHSKIEIDRAIKKVDEELANKAPILNTKPTIKYEIVPDEYSSKNNDSGKKSFWERLFGK